MPIYELYSQRKRRAERSGKEDVYRYDSSSPGLLVQLEQIFRDGIGRYWEPQAYSMNSPANNNEGWIDLRKALAREKKVHYLANVEAPDNDVLSYLTSRSDIDDVLDVVELLCWYVDIVLGSLQPYDRTSREIEEKPKDVILEVNYRLREDGLGFQYEAKQIVRVDSQFIHSEVVKPALTLLAQSGFSGAQEEFLRAHQLYREGSAKDAVTWAKGFREYYEGRVQAQGLGLSQRRARQRPCEAPEKQGSMA